MYSAPKEFIPFTGDIDSVEHSVDIHNRYLKNNAVLDRAKELQIYSIQKKIRDKVCFEAIKRGVVVPNHDYWYKSFDLAFVSPEYFSHIIHDEYDKSSIERGMTLKKIEILEELGSKRCEYVSKINSEKSYGVSNINIGDDYIIGINNLVVNIIDVKPKEKKPEHERTVLYYDEVFFRYSFSDSVIIEV